MDRGGRLTLLFVGHDGYFKWTQMAVDHFNVYDYPKLHLSHTKRLELPDVTDHLAPQFLLPPDGDPYHRAGKDLWVDRLIEGVSTISTKYVWFVQSDHMYIKLPSQSDVNSKFLDKMDHFRLDQLKLYIDCLGSTSGGPNHHLREVLHEDGDFTIRFSGDDHYPISHHATIFRTEWLLQSLLEAKRAGIPNAHGHELLYYVGGYQPAQSKIKYTESDDKPWRIAEATGTGVYLLSVISIGKLREEAIVYLHKHCTHPNREFYIKKEVGYDVLEEDLTMKDDRKQTWEADIANHKKTSGRQHFVGYGSVPCEIVNWGTLDYVKRLLSDYNITSINDVACGYFANYMAKLDFSDITYNGFDIVGETIKTNKKDFPHVNFHEKDIVTDELPYADLVVARDIFFHLNNNCLSRVLENIYKSKSKYLLATHHRQIEHNHDMDGIVGYRCVNLELEPFNVGDPIETHIEPAPGGGFSNRHLSLWEL